MTGRLRPPRFVRVRCQASRAACAATGDRAYAASRASASAAGATLLPGTTEHHTGHAMAARDITRPPSPPVASAAACPASSTAMADKTYKRPSVGSGTVGGELQMGRLMAGRGHDPGQAVGGRRRSDRESLRLIVKCRWCRPPVHTRPSRPWAGRRRALQTSRGRPGDARLGCAGSTAPAARPRCPRISSMSAGGSMPAMTRSRPPHCRQVSMSMANARLRRCAQGRTRAAPGCDRCAGGGRATCRSGIRRRTAPVTRRD